MTATEPELTPTGPGATTAPVTRRVGGRRWRAATATGGDEAPTTAGGPGAPTTTAERAEAAPATVERAEAPPTAGGPGAPTTTAERAEAPPTAGGPGAPTTTAERAEAPPTAGRTETRPRAHGPSWAPAVTRVRRFAPAGAGVLLLVAVAVRFSAWSPLWLDEAQGVAIARLPVSQLFGALREDGAPPLYYLVLHGWIRVVGDGALAVRALSGLIGVATLPLAYVAGRRVGRRAAGVATLALLATSPFAIRYSTEARMYALVILLVFAGFVVFARAWEQPSRGRLAALAVVTGLLLLTHYWSLYLVAAVVAVVAVGALRGHPSARPVLVALGGGIVGFLPWVPSFVFQLQHTGAPWAWSPSFTDLIDAARDLAGDGHGVQWLMWLGMLALIALGALGERVPGGVHLRWPPRPAPAVLAVVVTMTLALALAAGKLTSAPITGRYLAVVFPLGVLLAGVGIATLGRRGAVAVLVALGTAGLVVGTQEAARPRTQVAQVAEAIRARARRGDLVVYCPDQLGPSGTRLLPRALAQVAYPGLTSPQRVDWVDYQDRIDDALPFSTALDLDQRAGKGDIWFVTSPIYVNIGDACRRLETALKAVRPRSTEVVTPSGNYDEQARLARFRG